MPRRTEALPARVSRLLAAEGLPKGVLAIVRKADAEAAAAARAAALADDVEPGEIPETGVGATGGAAVEKAVGAAAVAAGGTGSGVAADGVHLSDMSESSDEDEEDGVAVVEASAPGAWRCRGGDWQICDGAGAMGVPRRYRIHPPRGEDEGRSQGRDPRKQARGVRAYGNAQVSSVLQMPAWAADVLAFMETTRTPPRAEPPEVPLDRVPFEAQHEAPPETAPGVLPPSAEPPLPPPSMAMDAPDGGEALESLKRPREGEHEVGGGWAAASAGGGGGDAGKQLPPPGQVPPPRLPLEDGDWYYYDGQWLSHGPYSLAELRQLARGGTKARKGLTRSCMVHRKADDVWTPLLEEEFPDPRGEGEGDANGAGKEDSDDDSDFEDFLEAEEKQLDAAPRAPAEVEALLRAELVKSLLRGALRRRLLDQVVQQTIKGAFDAREAALGEGGRGTNVPKAQVAASVAQEPRTVVPIDSSDDEGGALAGTSLFAARLARERRAKEEREEREARAREAAREAEAARAREAQEQLERAKREAKQRARDEYDAAHKALADELRETGLLPPVLLQMVLQCVKADKDGETMASAAATCKAFERAARRVVFSTGGNLRSVSAMARAAGAGAQAAHQKIARMQLSSELPQLLGKLRKLDVYGVFAKPVDTREYPDYPTIVSQPMDFSTMARKLGEGLYNGHGDWEAGVRLFRRDVELVCSNCLTYNGDDGNDYALLAHRVLAEGGRLIDEVETNLVETLFGGAKARQSRLERDAARRPATDELALGLRAARRPPRRRRRPNVDLTGGRRVKLETRTEIPASIPYVQLPGEYDVVCEPQVIKRKRQAAPLPPGQEAAAGTMPALHPLELPVTVERAPPKVLGVDCVKEEAFGIDGYTHQILLKLLIALRADKVDHDAEWSYHWHSGVIEDQVVFHAQTAGRRLRDAGEEAVALPLLPGVELAREAAEARGDADSAALMRELGERMKAQEAKGGEDADSFLMHSKGHGIVCNKEGGFQKDEFIEQYLGEMYTPWRWFERQDAIRASQRDLSAEKESPEFYNITLERPAGDTRGFDIIYVEAMYRTAFVSRLSHSCLPNCETRIKAVDGIYTIHTVTTRSIARGEELTFNYNCVTDIEAEAERAVCLCGSRACQGSYVIWKGSSTFKQVLDRVHTMPQRHALLWRACQGNDVCDTVSPGTASEAQADIVRMAGEEGAAALARAAVGASLLTELPAWLVRYLAGLAQFCEQEKAELPDALMAKPPDAHGFVYTRHFAEGDAFSNYSARVGTIAVTIDRARRAMDEWRKAQIDETARPPPPVVRCGADEVAERLWLGEEAVARRLLGAIRPHLAAAQLEELSQGVVSRDGAVRIDASSGDLSALRTALLWLRDALLALGGGSDSARHDLAADLLHLHAHSKLHLTLSEYAEFQSEPVEVMAADLPPVAQAELARRAAEEPARRAEMLKGGPERNCDGHLVAERREGTKYERGYMPAQLLNWNSEDMAAANVEPSTALQRRGCIQLPDIRSCYAAEAGGALPKRAAAGQRKRTVAHLQSTPNRGWPPHWCWRYDAESRPLLSSPMLDLAAGESSREEYDEQIVGWLRARCEAAA